MLRPFSNLSRKGSIYNPLYKTNCSARTDVPPELPKKASKTPSSSIPGKSRTPQSRLRPKSQFGIATGSATSRLPTNGSATLESPSSRIRPPAPFQKKSNIQVPKSKSELGNKPVTKLAFVSTSKAATANQSESAKTDSTPTETKPPQPPGPPPGQPPPLPPTPQEATKNVVKLINAAEKAPPIPAKSSNSSQLPPKHSKINVPNQLPESANQKTELSADRKLLITDKPPTPPERTTSSSSMKDIEMTVEDLEIEVPQEKEVPPAQVKVIDVHESSKIEQVEKSEKSEKKSDDKKSKLGSKLSKVGFQNLKIILIG